MDNFDNRLKYQKVVYLLQTYGLSLGYGYSWYIKGPYSPDLTKVLFNITPELYEESKNLKFGNEIAIDEKIISWLKTLELNINDNLFLEVLSSLIFINRSINSSSVDCPKLKEALLNKKPKLASHPRIGDVFNRACRLIPNFAS